MSSYTNLTGWNPPLKKPDVLREYLLLPCPFCGKADRVELRSDFLANPKKSEDGSTQCMTAFVKCWHCYAEGGIKDSCTGGTENDAVIAWNRRDWQGVHHESMMVAKENVGA